MKGGGRGLARLSAQGSQRVPFMPPVNVFMQAVNPFMQAINGFMQAQRVPLQARQSTRSCRLSMRSCRLSTHSCRLSTGSCRLSVSLCRLGSQHVHAGCQRVHAGCQRVMQTASSGLDRSRSPTMVNILRIDPVAQDLSTYEARRYCACVQRPSLRLPPANDSLQLDP